MIIYYTILDMIITDSSTVRKIQIVSNAIRYIKLSIGIFLFKISVIRKNRITAPPYNSPLWIIFSGILITIRNETYKNWQPKDCTFLGLTKLIQTKPDFCKAHKFNLPRIFLAVYAEILTILYGIFAEILKMFVGFARIEWICAIKKCRKNYSFGTKLNYGITELESTNLLNIHIIGK